MSNENAPADPPIIVQGGNSVDVDVPGKFKDKGPDGKGGKKYRNDEQHLDTLTIDNGTPIQLQPNSKIVITYK